MPYFVYETNPKGMQAVIYTDLPWSSSNGHMKPVLMSREITEEEAKLEISELMIKYPKPTSN